MGDFDDYYPNPAPWTAAGEALKKHKRPAAGPYEDKPGRRRRRKRPDRPNPTPPPEGGYGSVKINVEFVDGPYAGHESGSMTWPKDAFPLFIMHYPKSRFLIPMAAKGEGRYVLVGRTGDPPLEIWIAEWEPAV